MTSDISLSERYDISISKEDQTIGGKTIEGYMIRYGSGHGPASKFGVWVDENTAKNFDTNLKNFHDKLEEMIEYHSGFFPRLDPLSTFEEREAHEREIVRQREWYEKHTSQIKDRLRGMLTEAITVAKEHLGGSPLAMVTARTLYDELMTSDNPRYIEVAVDIASKHIDTRQFTKDDKRIIGPFETAALRRQYDLLMDFKKGDAYLGENASNAEQAMRIAEILSKGSLYEKAQTAAIGYYKSMGSNNQAIRIASYGNKSRLKETVLVQVISLL